MAHNNKPLTARCPECDSRIYFERRPETGEMISCPECNTFLEVISVSPLRLDWATEALVGEGNDWADDDFFSELEDDEDDDLGYKEDDED